MRPWLMLLLSVPVHLAAQESRPACSLACIEELTVPIYPPLAVQASIQGAGTVEGRCSGDRIEAAAVAARK